MFTDAFIEGTSPIHRLDPRTRVLAAAALSVAVASVFNVAGLAVACVNALGLALVARLPLVATLVRLRTLNLFLLVLWLVLPVTTAGPALFHVYVLSVTSPGLWMALAITLKANAIVLTLTALITTMDATELGRALHRLRVSPKLVMLFLLTGRYIAVLQAEYLRLRRAMRVRCFTPRTDRHTLRSLGYLVGMLLVNGLDRSERILNAMKCRGYTGAFPVTDAFAFERRDVMFAGVTMAVVVCVLVTGVL